MTSALLKYLDVTQENIDKALSNSNSYYYDTLCGKLTYDEVKDLKKYLNTEEGESLEYGLKNLTNEFIRIIRLLVMQLDLFLMAILV